MIKHLFFFILASFLIYPTFAQKKEDTTIYYLQNSGKIVSTKDSADYFLVVLPPDTSVDKNLFIIKGYYPNGNIRFIGKSRNNTLKLKYQGTLIAYFPDGIKKRVVDFENGEPVGDVIEYYPNGKLYNIKTNNSDKSILFKECRDSTGKVLTENGNGRWQKFDEKFKNIEAEGQVKNGLGFGEWRTKMTDSSDVINEYKNGKIVSMANSYKSGIKTYFMVEIPPEFPGGLGEFSAFLSHNIVYPKVARQNGTQGRVIITFIVEKDGSLGNLKVVRGIGDGCDEEALRVMKLSPPWKPAYQDGNPVRVVYTVPISYSLKK